MNRTIAKSLPSKRTVAPASQEIGKKTKIRPAVAVLEVSVEEGDQIGSQQKVVFATEIVNVTLRELSAAIKSPTKERKKTPLRRTSSNFSCGNNPESRGHNPLQPLNINRLANKPNEKPHVRRSTSTNTPDERIVGLQSQAQCGRIAFATLRLMEDQSGSPKIPYLQLESGMSALIGRMITLGFEDLAMKELRILRRRLEACSCTPSEQTVRRPATCSAKISDAGPKAETLADLLSFENINAQGQLLSLIIATQLQILKILGIKNEPHSTKSAIKHLRLEANYCPANMILRQTESGMAASRAKAAQQLESLAQYLMALCPSTSTAEDSVASSHGLLPDMVFELQTLAFQIRLIWWKLSGHQVDLKMELLDPFNRCLNALQRRSKISKKEKYGFARTSFDIIADFVRARANFLEKDLSSGYNVMADLAQDSAQYSDAIEWTKKSRDCAGESCLSPTRLCTLNCRLASLHVRLSDTGPNETIFQAFKSAAISLAGNLQGESAELDELLVNVASLRRSAFFVFQDGHKPSDPNVTQYSSALIQLCSEIILLSLRFVLRYVGSCSSPYVNGKTTARRDQRRHLAAQVSNPIMSSVATIARFSAKTTQDNWAKLEAGLRDCSALAIAVEDTNLDDRQILIEDKHGSPFVAISNAYWFRYLYLRQLPSEICSSRTCLRRGIDVMKSRPVSEQKASSLVLKLEKEAQISESLQEHQRATEIYQEAFHIQISQGMLKIAKEAAEVRSMPDALDSKEELGTLSRMLSAYPKAAANAIANGCCVEPFLDVKELCTEERGVLLEQQLNALLLMRQKHCFVSRDSQVLNRLAKTLLSIYDFTMFPIRRLRVVVRLLGLLCSESHALDSELKGLLDITERVPEGAHLDMKLLKFLPHLLSSREVLANMCHPDFDVKKLEAIMATWSKMLCGNPSWQTLETQIYDMSDWLGLLETVVDYLGALGLELTKVSVLHVLVSVHEAAISTQCSSLVSKLSSLGLQYSRLGYSGIAGDIFRKAQKFLEASDVPTEVGLRLQLDYAEHSLYNGDSKRW